MSDAVILILTIVITVVISVLAGAFIAYLIIKRRSISTNKKNFKPCSYQPIISNDKEYKTQFSRSPDTPTEFFSSGAFASARIHPWIRSDSRLSMSPSSHDEFGQIDPALYEIETIGEETPKGPYLGEIKFSLFYDTFRSVLKVTLLAAYNLCFSEEHDDCKHLDPYVTITLQPEYRHLLQSKVQQKTRNPVFNETFEFEVLFANLYMQSLWFTVFNFLSDSRHNVIGQTVLPLEDLQPSTEQTFTIELKPTTEKMPLGDILFSLGYLRIAGRLTLIIMKARNLPQVSVRGTDPYVRVVLIQNGRRTKKKKTSVKKNMVNPVFNEAISFDISKESLDTTGLLLTVIHDTKVIGCVMVGFKTKDKELEHWERMMVSDKPIAEWHTLQDGRKFY